MRQTFLPFALPDIDQREIAEVTETLESGWVTTGAKTRQFEAAFAETVGAKHAIAVNSCTAAMHLALEAIGLQRGDIVITTPYTFAATAEVIRYFDAVPVFVDVERETLNMDPLKLAITLERLVRGDLSVLPGNGRTLERLNGRKIPRVRAVIPVHIAGLPAEMDTIAEVARRHNLAVIEDAAHAFPAAYKGRWIGAGVWSAGTSNGNSQSPVPSFSCFSFYATKTITTGEGGMICTDNDSWAERCRIMALHGISKDAWKRYTAEGSWYYEIVAPGYKYNLTDIAAALGLAQLRKAEVMWKRRREIARRYNEAFREVPELQIPADCEHSQHAWHLYMLRLNLEQLRIDRAEFIEELKRRNIGTSVHFIPLHVHPYYRETYGYRPEDFPVAYGEYQREISLPIYSKMTDEDVEDVIEAVLEVVRLGARDRRLVTGGWGPGGSNGDELGGRAGDPDSFECEAEFHEQCDQEQPAVAVGDQRQNAAAASSIASQGLEDGS